MDRLLRTRCLWLGMVLMLAGTGMAQTWAASSGAVDPARSITVPSFFALR